MMGIIFVTGGHDGVTLITPSSEVAPPGHVTLLA